jgi:hypothetical protein
MTNYPYILFNQPPEDLRRIGARGGRAYGRNRRGLPKDPDRWKRSCVPFYNWKRPQKRSRPRMRSFPGCEVREIAPLGGGGDFC